MHFILHIGTHKTGTTSIQDALRASASVLLEQGILFPEAGCPPGQSGQHMLSWSIRADKQHKLPPHVPPVWDHLFDELNAATPKITILSAESFSGMKLSELEELRRRLDGYDVTVVLYLRSPLAYLKSSYKQHIKSGKCTTSFSNFMHSHAKDTDYGSLVQGWKEVFGARCIKIRIFEKAVRRGLLKDFAQVVGIDELLTENNVQSNLSPPDEIIRVVRYLNLVEQLLAVDGTSTLARRGLIERVRRRLVRGGPTSNLITALSRGLGVPPLHDEIDEMQFDNYRQTLIKKERMDTMLLPRTSEGL